MSAVAQAKWDVAYFPVVAQVAQQMQKGRLEKKENHTDGGHKEYEERLFNGW